MGFLVGMQPLVACVSTRKTLRCTGASAGANAIRLGPFTNVEASRLSPGPRKSTATLRVARLAARQWGVVTWSQLERSGMSASAISRARAAGRLHRVHPRVYAVGHRTLSIEGRLAAALFYVGVGAALSHATAAWWWRLLPDQPRLIHVSAPRRHSSTPGVRVHQPRHLERVILRGLPVTTVPRTLLDVASTLPFPVLRRALAEAEYLRLVELAAVEAVLRPGQPGTAALREALRHHRPELARTRSILEERFIALCETHAIPLPAVNETVAGMMVDMLWQAERLVVELDGHAAHRTPVAISRDRRRELVLREAGFRVLRYSWQQVIQEPGRVAADVLAALNRFGVDATG